MAIKGDFKKDSGAWAREFNTPGGMVGGYLYNQAKAVERAAKVLAPKGSGRLANSIDTGLVKVFALGGLGVDVTASAPYALAVHEGTSPHVIHPDAGGVLVFPASGGGIVFAEEVHHPGTTGQPFLNDALIMVTRGWDHVTGRPKPPVY